MQVYYIGRMQRNQFWNIYEQSREIEKEDGNHKFYSKTRTLQRIQGMESNAYVVAVLEINGCATWDDFILVFSLG